MMLRAYPVPGVAFWPGLSPPHCHVTSTASLVRFVVLATVTERSANRPVPGFVWADPA